MKLIELTMGNFLSVGEAKIPLADQGLVLIEGTNSDDPTAASNGAGKSTVFEALLWGLYGVTARGLSNEEVVKHGEKGCAVTVTFDDDNDVEWLVVRKAAPMKLYLYRDNVEQTQGRIRDTQEMLDGVIGMDAATFTSTVMFGQGNIAPFSTMTDAEQKDILERLIGLGDIEVAHVKAKALSGMLGADLDRLQDGLQRDWEGKERLEKESDEAWDTAKAWASQQKEKLREVDADIRTEEKASTEQDVGPYDRKVEKLKQEVLACENEIETQAEIVAELALARSETTNEVGIVQRQIQAFDNVGPTCHACKQPVDPKHKMKHLRELRSALEAAEQEVPGAKKEYEEAVEVQTKLQSKLKSTRGTLSDAKERMEEVKSENVVARRAQAALERHRKRREALLKETNTWDAQAKKLKVKIDEAQRKIKDAEAKTEALREDIRHAEFVVTMFSNKGLKSFVLDAVVPFLNEHANHYASVLSGDAIQVTFNTQSTLKTGEKREKFSVEVTNAHGADVYKGNSGGEKRKIDVAIALAMQALAAARSKSQINVSFYDEPFDALDSTAGEYAMEVLREEAKKKDSIFVITHREEFRANFSHVWRAVKQHNTTRILTND